MVSTRTGWCADVRQASPVPRTALDRLRNELGAGVHAPGDPGYEAAHTPWNLAVEQRPGAVADIGDEQQALGLVRLAREHGLRLAVQPSGHGASGTASDALLVRTRRLDTVTVDADRQIATVGAGATWGQVQSAAAGHGLTGLPGSSPVVTVTGYLLGGGLSWFSRPFGWAADSVRALDVIDADGVRRRVTSDSDGDLFWALRGGGGDFALVTSIDVALFPCPLLYGGRMVWPLERAAAVLEAFLDVTRTAPDELTVWFETLCFPGADPAVAVDTTYLGPADEAVELTSGLGAVPGCVSDTRHRMGVDEIGSITAEPTDPSPGVLRGELLGEVDVDAVVRSVGATTAPVMTTQIRHLGGALARPSDTPHGPLDEPFSLYLFGAPATAGDAATIRAKQRELVEPHGASVSGRKPFTFLTPGDTQADCFDGEALRRLRAIKRARDPAGMFVSNYPLDHVPPDR
jgi:FAD/FMN-containing dehydrogenase